MVANAKRGRLTASSLIGHNPFLQIPQWFLFFEKTKNKLKRNTVRCVLAVSPESQWSSGCGGRTPAGERVWEENSHRPLLIKSGCLYFRPSRSGVGLCMFIGHLQWANDGTVMMKRIKIPLKVLFFSFVIAGVFLSLYFPQVLSSDHLLFWIPEMSSR